MSQQDGTQEQALLAPSTDNREAWQAYWQELGQVWRTEPEIDEERQLYLAERRDSPVDEYQGIYPFKHIKLKRADVEWLLATHENGLGPVDYSDETQRDRVGIDLRGADLRHANLQNLPLARLVGDVTWRQWSDLSEEQHLMAAVHLENADLKGAHLEEANLEYTHLQRADLRGAHLKKANLGEARMQGAYLEGAHLEGADLWLAHLDEAFIWGTNLAAVNFRETHLHGVHLNEQVILVNQQGVGPRLLDAYLDGTNLAVLRWPQVHMLGEEYEARKYEKNGRDPATRRKLYEEAVRANRQLALALQSQGLSEDAARFAYRAQVLQRKVLWLQGPTKFGAYLFSLLLALLTGYGYRMWRIVLAYALANSVYATLYFVLGLTTPPHLTWIDALLVSITAFHGRVFSAGFLIGSPQATVTAFEAVTGLLFEAIFVAMLTQRFFSK
jgi:uncharacterized protein YjbI with pentapeptide repeats